MRGFWIFVTVAAVDPNLRSVAVEHDGSQTALAKPSIEDRYAELSKQVKETYHGDTEGTEYMTLARTAGFKEGVGLLPPDVIVRPHTEKEVQASVRFAKDNNLPVNVLELDISRPRTVVPPAPKDESSYHALEHSLLERSRGYHHAHKMGMIVDMSKMNNVEVSGTHSASIVVGGGARWSDVYKTADEQDLNMNGGSMEERVADSVLSGGASWWGYRHGMIADSVVSARIVLPDGEVAIASEHVKKSTQQSKDAPVSQADMLYNLRGGFPVGIVTELTIRAYPAQPGFTMGQLQCTLPANPKVWIQNLLSIITQSEATIRLRISGSAMHVYFVADSSDALAPLLSANFLNQGCAAMNLQGYQSQSGSIGLAINGDSHFRYKRISDAAKYMAQEKLTNPSHVQGESRALMVRQDSVDALVAVIKGAVANPRYVTIDVMPASSMNQDSVGHAFPHRDPLIVNVRCTAGEICPKLWSELDTVSSGVYSANVAAPLPGDAAKMYGPTYRSAQCLTETLAPQGARFQTDDTADLRANDAQLIASQAQNMLNCPAPFLSFSTCAPQHEGTVVVTGGSTGLGRVGVRLLTQQGLKVIIADEDMAACAQAAEEVYLETGASPVCVQVDLRDPDQVEAFSIRMDKLAPNGLDALILAAQASPDRVDVATYHRADRAVQIVLGNLQLAHLLADKHQFNVNGRIVFATTREAFGAVRPETLDLLTKQLSYSETFLGSQALAAFSAHSLRLAHPDLSVGLAVTSTVRTPVIEEVLRAPDVSPMLREQLSKAPAGQSAIMASGAALLRALEPGFCADGCGELQCQLPTEGSCQMWAEASRFVPLPALGACPFSVRSNFLFAALHEGLSGVAAAAANVFLTLPLYNILDMYIHTGSGVREAAAAVPGYYTGLGTAMIVGPIARFGDTFAHAVAIAFFGNTTTAGVFMAAFTTAMLYPMWRLLVFVIALPEHVGLNIRATKGDVSNLTGEKNKVFTLLSSAMFAAFPFWFSLDSTTMMMSGVGSYIVGGALAGVMSCLCTVSGSGLMARLPLCAFEGAMFVVMWKFISFATDFA